MGNINTIQDGAPFTYELINQIIEKVNNLTGPEGDEEDAIEVDYPGQSNNETKPRISVGIKNVTVPKDRTSYTTDKIRYKGGDFNTTPVVIASIADNDLDDGLQMGHLSIKNIEKGGFRCKIKLIKARGKDVNFTINYIAIGGTS